MYKTLGKDLVFTKSRFLLCRWQEHDPGGWWLVRSHTDYQSQGQNSADPSPRPQRPSQLPHEGEWEGSPTYVWAGNAGVCLGRTEMDWVMILRAKPNLPIVPFSNDKENRPKWNFHFYKDQSPQCPCVSYRAAGVRAALETSTLTALHLWVWRDRP